MKQFRILLLCCICLFGYFSVGSLAALATESKKVSTGTTYYISDSEGKDSNNGLSEKAPWKTLQKATKVKLLAGDSILLKSGDVWYGQIDLDVSNGSRSNPIVISSYGTGNRPSLRYYTAQVTEGAAKYCLLLLNANGVEITNLDIGYANGGIRLNYSSYGHEYVKIENCHFHDIYGIIQFDNIDGMPFSAAIYVTITKDAVKKTKYSLTDFYVNRCTSYDAGSLTGYTSDVRNFYMTECVAEKNGSYGAVVTADGGYIDRCVFKDNGTRDMAPGSTGIMTSSRNFTIKNCLILNQQRQGDDPDGCGIDFEWGNHNVIVENCLIKQSAGVGIMFFASGRGKGGTNYDCIVRNNYFVDNSINVGNIGGFEIIATGDSCSNVKVYDNFSVVSEKSKSNTVKFSFTDVSLKEGTDVIYTNNTKINDLPKGYNPLVVATTDTSWIIWLLVGVATGIMGAIVFGVLIFKKKNNSKKLSEVQA